MHKLENQIDHQYAEEMEHVKCSSGKGVKLSKFVFQKMSHEKTWFDQYRATPSLEKDKCVIKKLAGLSSTDHLVILWSKLFELPICSCSVYTNL